MQISQGLLIRNLIEETQNLILSKGKPVIVRNQATLEILNHCFNISYNTIIDLEDIRKNMIKYYEEYGVDLEYLEEIEKLEYLNIKNELYEKFNILDEDKNSRQIIFTDDCCISMIQYLIRENTIYCFVNLRSSDSVNKLFLDLFLIHEITKELQEKMQINCTKIYFTANSMHKIAYKI